MEAEAILKHQRETILRCQLQNPINDPSISEEILYKFISYCQLNIHEHTVTQSSYCCLLSHYTIKAVNVCIQNIVFTIAINNTERRDCLRR